MHNLTRRGLLRWHLSATHIPLSGICRACNPNALYNYYTVNHFTIIYDIITNPESAIIFGVGSVRTLQDPVMR